MRKFLTAVVLIPLGLLLLVFAVANRHWITVSFNPFEPNDPSLGITLPLFAVIILSLVVGVLVGGSATWFRQRHWRRSARRHEAAAQAARAELADLRAARPASGRVPAALPDYGTGAAGQDKRGLTL